MLISVRHHLSLIIWNTHFKHGIIIHSVQKTLTASVHGTETVPHLAIKHTRAEFFNTAHTSTSQDSVYKGLRWSSSSFPPMFLRPCYQMACWRCLVSKQMPGKLEPPSANDTWKFVHITLQFFIGDLVLPRNIVAHFGAWYIKVSIHQKPCFKIILEVVSVVSFNQFYCIINL